MKGQAPSQTGWTLRFPHALGTLLNHPRRVLSVLLTVVIWLSLFMSGLALPGTAAGQLVDPPMIVHWVGPEADCDYLTIQDALGDIFDCGLFACEVADHKIRLSKNYVHSGQIEVSHSIDIVGGFGEGCGTTKAGPVATLGNPPANESLIVIAPGNRTIINKLIKLAITGPGNQSPPSPLGGVIRMEAGDATLTLKDSAVRNGAAVLGGGVYLAGDGNRLILDNGSVQNSEAISGGGIYCTRGGVIDFQSGRIEDNIAERSGGGVFLNNSCLLRGIAAGNTSFELNRSITGNRLTEIQNAQGAGIYALASTVQMGALYSLTEIRNNVIPAFIKIGELGSIPVYDHYRYDLPGANHGGGVHLDRSQGEFYNTRFIGNEASNGGALSVFGNSTLLVDRTSGPCLISDTGDTETCSQFKGNWARGGRDNQGEEGGDGAVVYAVSTGIGDTYVEVNRSHWIGNSAGCFESAEPDFNGPCDIDESFDVDFETSTSSLIASDRARLHIQGNLIHDNDIDEDCGSAGDCNYGSLFDAKQTNLVLAENTLAGAETADGVTFFFGPDRMANNIIELPAVSEFAPGPIFAISTCNISVFADELIAEGGDNTNESVDPSFVDPANSNYRLQLPISPAIDRCDGDHGLASSTYDIVGNPRPIDITAKVDEFGIRDVGAFEAIPLEGVQQNTTDLSIDVHSDRPKTAPLSVDHEFLTTISNTGRNAATQFSVQLALASDATLSKLVGQVAPAAVGQNVQRWNCDVLTRSCLWDAEPLAVGGHTPPIIAEIAHSGQGERTVSATVSLDDVGLVELTPANDTDGDTVTVGPGADLQLGLSAADPSEVSVGQFAQFTVRIQNNGPEVAEAVQVRVEASSSITVFGQFDAPGWNCVESSEAIRPTMLCTLQRTLDLLINEGGVPLTFDFGATGPDPGDNSTLVHQAIATVFADNPGDPNDLNNSATEGFTMLSDGLFSDGFESAP